MMRVERARAPSDPSMGRRRRFVLLFLALGGLAVVFPPATAQSGRGVVRRSVPITHAENLGEFKGALAELGRGARNRVRVMHYGDSNVAADLWSRVVRETFHERYGDAGPGYLVPLPWGSRTDPRVRFEGADRWQPRRLGFARDFGPRDGLWGLGGVAVAGTSGQRLAMRVPAMGVSGSLEVHALAEPRGGLLRLEHDGEVHSLSLRAGEPGLTRLRRPIGPSASQAQLVVTRGSARLLGVVVELERPGIIYDVLGINGHRASAIKEWNEALLRAQLEGRAPSLVILSYGANEALDPGLPLERYERNLRASVEKVKRLMPTASILLVGPVAMCPRNRRNEAISAIESRVAGELGCAFWETMAVSGGPGSLCGWTRARPSLVSRDGLHLNRLGYRVLGEELTSALLSAIAR